ncbi:hypothetical protein, partial [Bradyrhizobium cosmicum]|uniref:hypothetical protein n=1 Tax=Bradyrhizobium cosmicum TaxID=1404864 RepID=UPI0028E743A5
MTTMVLPARRKSSTSRSNHTATAKYFLDAGEGQPHAVAAPEAKEIAQRKANPLSRHLHNLKQPRQSRQG